MLQELVDRFRAIDVGERDRHDPERIFDEFAVRSAQGVDFDERGRCSLRDQHGVEHAREGLEAAMIVALLEQRPTVLVEALVEECRCRPEFDDGFISGLRSRIRLGGEQQLAAPKLRLVEEAALGELGDEPVEGGQRLVDLRVELVGARELVEHRIVALVLGVSLQQRAVQRDCLLRVQPLVGCKFALDALGLSAFQMQIPESPHRLGAQLRIARVQIEEPLVGIHGLRGADSLRRVGLHLDLALVDILDRGRRRRGRARGGKCQGQRHAEQRGRQQAAQRSR